jgi:hemin uptake protein HemP
MEATAAQQVVQESAGEGESCRLGSPSPSAIAPRWGSRELLRGERVAVIVHDGVEYRLQLTRQNRLLLTK